VLPVVNGPVPSNFGSKGRMKSESEIQFARLLGFSNLADKLSAAAMDFNNAAFDARLGAKIGSTPPPKSGELDFRDATFEARLGAKLGEQPPPKI
jgi:hypothetical protein